MTFNAAGTTDLLSARPPPGLLTLGTTGITLGASAGAVALGASGSAVNVVLSGTQSGWTNNSSATLTVLGGIDTASGVNSRLVIAGAGPTVLSGALSGGAGRVLTLAKSGAGDLRLSASNSFSGGLTLSAGTLSIANAAALGSGTFAINGGTIDNVTGAAATLSTNPPIVLGGSLTFRGTDDLDLGTSPVNLNGAGRVIDVAAKTLTVNGISGAGQMVTKNGAGTLVVTGPSTYGATTVDSGTLRLEGAGTIGTGALNGVISVSRGGTLDLNGVSTSIGFFDRSLVYLALTGNGSGTAAVRTGSGTLTFTNQNSNGNTIAFTGSNGAVGFVSGNLRLLDTTVSYLTISIADSTNTEADVVMAANLVVTNTAGTGLQLRKSGVGTLALSSTANHWGSLAINAGVVRLDGPAVLPAGNVVVSAILGLNYSGTFTRSFGGGLQVSGGGFAAYGNTVRTLNADGTVDFQNPFSLTSVSAQTGTREFRMTKGLGTLPEVRLSGSISGNANINKTGGGTLELTAANTYSGTTTVSAGTLLLSNGLALQNSVLDTSGTGSVALDAATAFTFGGLIGATDLESEITSGYRTMTALTLRVGSGTSRSYSGTITDGAPGMTVTKTGLGTQILGGSNSYTGLTTVSAGTLQLGVGSDLSGGIANAASLVLLQGGPTAATVSGLISGTGLVSCGGGTVILSNTANTYSGQTAIRSGVAEVALVNNGGLDSPLGTSGTIALGADTDVGTLRYVGSGHSTDRVINLAGSAGGGGTLDASGSGTVAFTGGVTSGAGLTLMGSNTGANFIQGITSGSVTKTGVGTWVLGTSSFLGRLTVEQGTVIAGVETVGSGSLTAFGNPNSSPPVIGLADVSGTAALLAASGITVDRTIEVATLGTGNQEVILGGSGTGMAVFQSNATLVLGRDVTLAADPGGTVVFNVPIEKWQTSGASGGTAAITIGTPTATGTVTLTDTTSNTITRATVRQGTLRLGNGGAAGGLDPATELTGSAGATLAFNRSDTITSGVDFAATISGGMNVSQIGAGTVVLNGSGTLALGIDDAIPNASVVTLGSGTSRGTLDMGSFTDTVAGLGFSGLGGTLRNSGDRTASAHLISTGGITLGATADLVLTSAGSTAGLYRLVSAPSVSGAFASVSGTSAAYQVVYTSTSVDYQQRAVLGAVNVTSPVLKIITGGSAAFTYTAANTALSGGQDLAFTGAGLANIGGASSGTAAGGATSATTGGLAYTGTTVGLGQIGTFTVNAASAFGATATTGTVTIDVLNHSLASFAASSLDAISLNLGTFNSGVWTSGSGSQGFSIWNITSGGFTDAQTAGLALYDVLFTSGNDVFMTGLANFLNLEAGTANGSTASVASPGSLAQGTYQGVYTLKFRDQQDLSGATNTRDLTLTLNVIVVPEPRTLVLAGVGLTAAAWGCRRRRRDP